MSEQTGRQLFSIAARIVGAITILAALVHYRVVPSYFGSRREPAHEATGKAFAAPKPYSEFPYSEFPDAKFVRGHLVWVHKTADGVGYFRATPGIEEWSIDSALCDAQGKQAKAAYLRALPAPKAEPDATLAKSHPHYQLGMARLKAREAMGACLLDRGWDTGEESE